MSDVPQSLTRKTFKNLHPLNVIDDEYQDLLLEKSILTVTEPGNKIIKSGELGSLRNYLVTGEIELRHSFDNRENISLDDERCRFPLEELVQVSGLIRAVSQCTVLIVNADFVDELMSRSQSLDYGIVHLHETSDYLDTSLVHDEMTDNWQEIFTTNPSLSWTNNRL